jgi:hypothetical protein
MPFIETNELPPDPAVRIFFSGLMIIQPSNDGESCEVFVNRAALDHCLSIEVRLKRPIGPDIVLMRQFGPLSFIPPANLEPLRHGFQIISDDPKGLRSYCGPALASGEDSFGLAINLKEDPFNHSQPLQVDPKGGRPSIELNDGIFYTAEKTSEKLQIKLDKGGLELKAALQPFASLIGANVYLDEGATLQLRWFELGTPNVLELTKPEEGFSFEIYILNDPLYIDEEAAEVHDEFKEYYKILSPVPDQDQFMLDVIRLEEEGPSKGTARTPCMSVVLNAPTG